MDIINYTYKPPVVIDSDLRRITCYHLFEFELINKNNDIIIHSLKMTGHAGCKGHPKTISAFVKDRKISDIPLDELAKAECSNESSCAQELVSAIEQIKKDLL